MEHATLSRVVTPSSPDPVMTSREAANMLGVSITTAQMWMESGMLASWKTPGGHRRTRLSSVMTLIDQRKMPPSAQALEMPTGKIVGEDTGRSRFVEQVNTRLRPDSRFDRLTWLASGLLDMPISMITFLTTELQIFKSALGLNMSSTPRAWAFCNYTITQPGVFCVPDAKADPRFASNPMVTSAPFFRFYAGVRLTYEGKALGSLCVADTEPRILRSHEQQALEELGLVASDLLKLHILESR